MHIYDDKGNFTKEYVAILQNRNRMLERQKGSTKRRRSSFNPVLNRAFEAAYSSFVDPSWRSSGGKYPRSLLYGDTLNLNHYELRQNARKGIHDSSILRSIANRFVDNIVDVGLTLNLQPEADILGIDKEYAAKWAYNQNRRFHLWAKDKKCSLRRDQSFYQGQRSIAFFQQRDNDYFIRLHYSKDPMLLNPLQFEFIDPDRIDGNSITTSYGFQDSEFDVKDGIERNDEGVEVAYWVKVRNRKTKQYESKRIPAFDKKSGLPIMLHGFYPEYAGQGRGFSLLADVLNDGKDLTTFTTSQIKKAIIQSGINMYISNKDADPGDPFESISQYTEGPFANSDTTLNQNDLDDSGDLLSYYAAPEADFVPGSMGVFSTRKGDQLNPFKETSPNEQYSQFVKAFVTNFAAARSMPVEVLWMQFNQNYSASRAALLMFYRITLIWAMELQTDALDPIKLA